MSRKISAYARKRRAVKAPLQNDRCFAEYAAFQTVATIACSAERVEGGVCESIGIENVSIGAADRAERVIRTAAQYLLDHEVPPNPEQELEVINAALILAGERILTIAFGKNKPRFDEDVDVEAMPESGREALAAVIAARQAWLRSCHRWLDGKHWGLDAAGRIDLQDGIDVSVQLMRASTVMQMEKAYHDANRTMKQMRKKGLLK